MAVDDVSFEVSDGEIFGLIGPNGAGKTTTMECVEGIRTPTPARSRCSASIPSAMSTRCRSASASSSSRRSCRSASRSGRRSISGRRSTGRQPSTADQLLEQLGLAEKRDAWFMTLSGGQKQRLFIALALINDPEVVFLDELTTGLDPQARRAIWELVRGIRERGKTVFLTTHLMEEAERLCDRVAIIEHGRIIDIDTPERLVDRHCPERSVTLATPTRTPPSALPAIPRVESVTRRTSTLHHSRPRRRSRDRRDPVPVGEPDPRHRFPHDAADARGCLPQAHRPLRFATEDRLIDAARTLAD